MKAFCLAFAFVLVALPASADELPQTSNAWRAIEPDLADPGNFQWTVLDDAAGGAQAPAAVNGQDARDKDAPARAALAQIRAETARVFAEARRASAKVQRIRYDLRVSCVVEEVAYEPDPLDNVSMPWIWDSIERRRSHGERHGRDVRGRLFAEGAVAGGAGGPGQGEPQPQMRDYKVSFPVE